LEERRLFFSEQMQKEKELEGQQKQMQEELQKKRNTLLQDEMKALKEQFSHAMNKIDSYAERLEWRRKRFELNIPRRDLLLADWNIFPIPDPEDIPPVVDTLYDRHTASHVDSGSNGLTTPDDDHSEITYESVSSNVLQSDQDFLAEKISSVEETEVQLTKVNEAFLNEEPTEILISGAMETIPQNTLVVGAHISDLDKEIRWIFDPSVIPFQEPGKQENKVLGSMNLQELCSAVTEMQSTFVSVDQTIHASVLELWKRQVSFISIENLSHLFSFSGRNDPRDVRFHFEIINSFYLFGSGHFQSRVVDRLFKASVTGISLNSLLSNACGVNPREILYDVFDEVVDSKGCIFNSIICEMISIDLKGQYKGIMAGADITKNLELVYHIPAPFDFVIDEHLLSHFGKVFSLMLSLLQSQEAFSRISMSKKWKKCTRGSADYSIIVSFIQHCQKFLSGFQHYAFHTAIAIPWKNLESEMNRIASNVHGTTRLLNPISLSDIKKIVYTHTEQILCNLFLLDEQEFLYNSMNDLFSLIIQFSRYMQDIPIPESIANLYFQFKAKMKSFLNLVDDRRFHSNILMERNSSEILEQLLFCIKSN
jgi:hypothetical protein